MGLGFIGFVEVYTGLWGVYSVSLGFRCFVISDLVLLGVVKQSL